MSNFLKRIRLGQDAWEKLKNALIGVGFNDPEALAVFKELGDRKEDEAVRALTVLTGIYCGAYLIYFQDRNTLGGAFRNLLKKEAVKIDENSKVMYLSKTFFESFEKIRKFLKSVKDNEGAYFLDNDGNPKVLSQIKQNTLDAVEIDGCKSKRDLEKLMQEISDVFKIRYLRSKAHFAKKKLSESVQKAKSSVLKTAKSVKGRISRGGSFTQTKGAINKADLVVDNVTQVQFQPLGSSSDAAGPRRHNPPNRKPPQAPTKQPSPSAAPTNLESRTNSAPLSPSNAPHVSEPNKPLSPPRHLPQSYFSTDDFKNSQTQLAKAQAAAASPGSLPTKIPRNGNLKPKSPAELELADKKKLTNQGYRPLTQPPKRSSPGSPSQAPSILRNNIKKTESPSAAPTNLRGHANSAPLSPSNAPHFQVPKKPLLPTPKRSSLPGQATHVQSVRPQSLPSRPIPTNQKPLAKILYGKAESEPPSQSSHKLWTAVRPIEFSIATHTDLSKKNNNDIITPYKRQLVNVKLSLIYDWWHDFFEKLQIAAYNLSNNSEKDPKVSWADNLVGLLKEFCNEFQGDYKKCATEFLEEKEKIDNPYNRYCIYRISLDDLSKKGSQADKKMIDAKRDNVKVSREDFINAANTAIDKFYAFTEKIKRKSDENLDNIKLSIKNSKSDLAVAKRRSDLGLYKQTVSDEGNKFEYFSGLIKDSKKYIDEMSNTAEEFYKLLDTVGLQCVTRKKDALNALFVGREKLYNGVNTGFLRNMEDIYKSGAWKDIKEIGRLAFTNNWEQSFGSSVQINPKIYLFQITQRIKMPLDDLFKLKDNETIDENVFKQRKGPLIKDLLVNLEENSSFKNLLIDGVTYDKQIPYKLTEFYEKLKQLLDTLNNKSDGVTNKEQALGTWFSENFNKIKFN